MTERSTKDDQNMERTSHEKKLELTLQLMKIMTDGGHAGPANDITMQKVQCKGKNLHTDTRMQSTNCRNCCYHMLKRSNHKWI